MIYQEIIVFNEEFELAEADRTVRVNVGFIYRLFIRFCLRKSQGRADVLV